MTWWGHAEGAESFTPTGYLRDHGPIILLGTGCIAGVFAMAVTLGIGIDASVTLSTFVLICLCLGLIVDYLRRARFWTSVEEVGTPELSACESVTLVADPRFLEGRLAQDAIDRLSAQASRELTQAQADADAYREYIELWIHETKTPIAAAKLILDRLEGPDAYKLSRELERMEVQVDQALYYARSTSLQKDYAIRSISLADAAREACKRQARFLIEVQAIPQVDIPPELRVLSDEPWLVFMLSQVVANAAQYGARTITFTARVEEPDTPRGCTVLEVRDDGCGISDADMPRIFDRGFTGSNGRARGTATGMGLYLVALMSSRLGLSVSAASETGVGTRMIFGFPHDRSRLP